MDAAEQQAADIGVKQCPNGCALDMLEIGKETESFHSALGLPFQSIRCGECGFNDETGGVTAALANTRDGAIALWNAAVDNAIQERAKK